MPCFWTIHFIHLSVHFPIWRVEKHSVSCLRLSIFMPRPTVKQAAVLMHGQSLAPPPSLQRSPVRLHTQPPLMHTWHWASCCGDWNKRPRGERSNAWVWETQRAAAGSLLRKGEKKKKLDEMRSTPRRAKTLELSERGQNVWLTGKRRERSIFTGLKVRGEVFQGETALHRDSARANVADRQTEKNKVGQKKQDNIGSKNRAWGAKHRSLCSSAESRQRIHSNGSAHVFFLLQFTGSEVLKGAPSHKLQTVGARLGSSSTACN